jgi:hypothetical protein
MDFGTLLAPVGTGAAAVVADVAPIGIPVLIALAGLGIALKSLGKFGVKR